MSFWINKLKCNLCGTEQNVAGGVVGTQSMGPSTVRCLNTSCSNTGYEHFTNLGPAFEHEKAKFRFEFPTTVKEEVKDPYFFEANSDQTLFSLFCGEKLIEEFENYDSVVTWTKYLNDAFKLGLEKRG
jgi:hypothetical protein